MQPAVGPPPPRNKSSPTNLKPGQLPQRIGGVPRPRRAQFHVLGDRAALLALVRRTPGDSGEPRSTPLWSGRTSISPHCSLSSRLPRLSASRVRTRLSLQNMAVDRRERLGPSPLHNGFR
jgi:hypothetical protein